jgi:hypothetical protein
VGLHLHQARWVGEGASGGVRAVGDRFDGLTRLWARGSVPSPLLMPFDPRLNIIRGPLLTSW